MKKIFYVSTIIAILIMLSGCGTTKSKPTINNPNNITKITVTTQPGNEKSLKTTENKNEITDIINYLNSLELKKTSKDAGQYNGVSYIITVYFDDKTTKEYVHFGDMFFKESGKDWYEIPYKQAEKFNNIYKNLGNK